MGAGAERTEVHELRAGWAREARAAAAAEVQPLGVAGPIVLAGPRGAGVHLLLAGSTQVACGKMQKQGGVKKLNRITLNNQETGAAVLNSSPL